MLIASKSLKIASENLYDTGLKSNINKGDRGRQFIQKLENCVGEGGIK